MEPLKKPLTLKDQVEHLKVFHGLEIEDLDEALGILSRVSYYRLSAYGIGLIQEENPEKYEKGISINSLFRLYTFDSALRNSIIHSIEQIEIQLRSQISNYLAIQYGAECYLDIKNFNDKRNQKNESIHENLLYRFKDECIRQSATPFVKHHNIKYGGHFPVWVAVELFSFGSIASLYTIMKSEDQKEIAKLYNTEPQYLKSWILSLVEVRNICAHYGRLYNMPLKQSPHLYKEHIKYRGKINKLFPVIIVIKRMLSSDDRWDALFTKLRMLLSDYNDVVRLSYIGFPNDWEAVLK